MKMVMGKKYYFYSFCTFLIVMQLGFLGKKTLMS